MIFTGGGARRRSSPAPRTARPPARLQPDSWFTGAGDSEGVVRRSRGRRITQRRGAIKLHKESSNVFNRRVSYSQLESLWEALNTRREIALGYNKSAQAREFARRMWEEVAITLNSHGGGAIKDGKGWSKYWNDYKSKLKKLVAERNSSAGQTGGGPPQGRPLSDIEEKFLQILGINYGQGLPGVRVEPFENIPLAGQELEIERLEELADDTATTSSAQPRPAFLTPQAHPPPPSLPTPRAQPPPPAPTPLAQPHSPAPTIQALPTEQTTPSRRGRSPRHRARRQRGNPPMTQEQARRTLVECSQQRLAIAERKAAALETICQELQGIKKMLAERLPSLPQASNDASAD